MLVAAGDILNWLAAGVLFPLMLLPLAPLAGENRARTTGAWASAVVGLVVAGMAFAALTPALRAQASGAALLTMTGCVGVSAAAIYAAGGARVAAKQFARAFDRATRATGRAVMWLLLAMALVQFAVVLLRYVFGINWILMQESITYMHGIVFLLAAGYALLTDDHVRVDIFYRDASPTRKAIVDLAGTYLFLFPICLIVLWTGSPYVARAWLVMEGSTDTAGLQGVFLLKTLIPSFAVLLSMAGFVVAHNAVETLQGRRD